MSAQKLYSAMKNMIALAIPGHDWTDEAGEQALQDAHKACETHEKRFDDIMSAVPGVDALRRIWQAWQNSRGGAWTASKADGTLDIAEHGPVVFADGDNAAFCAIAHENMRELMEYVVRLGDRIEVLRAELICQKDAVAQRDGTIAAQTYIISKLDSIIYAVEHPDLLRMIAEIDRRHVAENRVRVLELMLKRVYDIPGVRAELSKAADEAFQSALEAARIEERDHDN